MTKRCSQNQASYIKWSSSKTASLNRSNPVKAVTKSISNEVTDSKFPCISIINQKITRKVPKNQCSRVLSPSHPYSIRCSDDRWILMSAFHRKRRFRKASGKCRRSGRFGYVLDTSECTNCSPSYCMVCRTILWCRLCQKHRTWRIV